jgi:hypothetical protein
MGLAAKPQNVLARIVANGGGLDIEVGAKPGDSLVQLAALANKSGATLVFRGVSGRPADVLTRIAAAGGGRVIFGD